MSDEIVPTRDLARIKDSPANYWRHVVPVDRPWTDALDRRYWETVAGKLRAGDRIDVTSGDYRTQLQILVIGCNSNLSPPFLDLAFIGLWPPGLELPQPAPQVPPKFIIRMTGSSGVFDVLNAGTGETVRAGLYRHDAEQQAANLHALAPRPAVRDALEDRRSPPGRPPYRPSQSLRATAAR
jgi:hypothetical protein